MKVVVNDEPLELDQGSVVSDVLQRLEIADQNGIAVAINDTVVPKSSWNQHSLKERDSILLIRATQGG